MNSLHTRLKKIIPKRVFTAIQPHYHYALAYIGAVKYHHPSKNIVLIGITGTKGKSSTTEILAQILQADGKKVASLSTIQFKIGDTVEKNLFKMTMPGRFFVQQFLRKAVDAECEYAIVEMTSEGAKQFRHAFLAIDALIFTNLTPEHIESHGSFKNYKQAKLSLAEAVFNSKKQPRTLVANIDDEHGRDFLNFKVERIVPYGVSDLTLYSLHKDSISLVIENTTIRIPLVGLFNVYNALAAISYARSLGVSLLVIQEALRNLPVIAGRVQHIESPARASKKITAVVDYAHTPDSLQKLYEAFPDKPKICVLGNTGGGRDTWKRPEMGAIAEKFCDQIILTNEDPYDEVPEKIVQEMKDGMSANAPVQIIMDRTEAIKTALQIAPKNGYVLISGKGTDPYIMGPNDTKIPWSDAEVTRTLLAELASEQTKETVL